MDHHFSPFLLFSFCAYNYAVISKKKRKNWRNISPNVTLSEKAFKHGEVLYVLGQVLAMIIICSRKWYSDTKGNIYLDPLRSELCCLLKAMAFSFMPSAFLIFSYSSSHLSLCFD